MTENARKMRNAYCKKWRDANKEKVKEIHERYWERKAAAAERELREQDGGDEQQ